MDPGREDVALADDPDDLAVDDHRQVAEAPGSHDLGGVGDVGVEAGGGGVGGHPLGGGGGGEVGAGGGRP